MKHTPGPWMLPTYENEVMTVPMGDIKICRVYPVRQDDDCRANGNLIAAAPEMLEALEATCVFFESRYKFPENNRVYKMAKAAMDKAKRAN